MSEFLMCYKAHRFGSKTRDIVAKANEILAEYTAAGYVLTLRQLYYRFVAKDLIPDSWIDEKYNLAHGLSSHTKNTEKNYKRLGDIMVKGREAGLVSWTAIEDRSRTAYGTNCEEDQAEVLKGIEYGLVYDLWARQDTYLEVWVEKDALSGVISRPANLFRVNYMATKGYLSASEAWRGGMRFQRAIERGKECVMLHLGDHDPSGLDMTHDNESRLAMFVPDGVEVRRLALNMDQVKQFDPPPNPAKVTDSRFERYAEEFGHESWELDALEPEELDRLLTEAIKQYIDPGPWDRALAEERKERKVLAALSENWPPVKKLVVKRMAQKAAKVKKAAATAAKKATKAKAKAKAKKR